MKRSRVRGALAALAATTLLVAAVPARAQQAKCLAGKTGCMAREATGLLKCEALAVTPGKPADPNAGDCITKVHAKFDGGTTPAKGCFEKLESKSPNDCVTLDDTSAAETVVEACVASLVAAIAPPPLEQTKCGAAKTSCASKYLAALLKCRQTAQTPGKPADPNAKGCVDKAVAQYTGGADPAKGCFAKLEAKQPNDCRATNDAATVQALAESCLAAFVAVAGGTTSTTSTTIGTTTTTPVGSTTSTTLNLACPAALRCGTLCCDRGQMCANGACVDEGHPTPPCTPPLVADDGACVLPCGGTQCGPADGEICCSSGPGNGICCDGYTDRCAATQESCQTVACPAGHSYVASVDDCCPNANICGSGSFTDCCQSLVEVCAQPMFGLPQCEPRTIPPPHH